MTAENETARTLRIFRVEEGTTVHARTLSDGYAGLFTHYTRGRSVYCKGDQCDSVVHKVDRIWKGYAAVELWNVATKKWTPVVLEISEALELDLRGLWKRGQVWEFYRDRPTSKKAMPIMGKLLEERGPDSVPPPFDFKAVLMHLYHQPIIHLGALNPMPARILVLDSEGAPPAILEPAKVDEKPVDPKVEEEFRKRFNLNKRTPTERKKSPA